MATKSQRPKGREGALSLLNAAIEAVNLAKEASSITPAQAAFGAAGVLLTMIKESMINALDYVELGLFCADICKALDRGMNGKKLGDLSQSVCDAINQLTTTVAEMQNKVIKQSKRNVASRVWHARSDKEMIGGWKSELNRILVIFNTELIMNTHTIITNMDQKVSKLCEEADGKNRATQNSAPGESPPPPPRIFFGRDELIEKIVGFAERLIPIALVGAGGIGKTSTALTVLHDDRVKQRFGDNRRFIRCDKFPPSLPHFLRHLSKSIGAGIENPEDLAPLRPFLSSEDVLIVLDNAESILDPQGPSAQEIYEAIEELGHLTNIWLCITSRISTFPPDFERFDIPTLSEEAACDTFYRIYKCDERSDLIRNILEQLDFHALSITLLATVAHHNRWDTDRLAKEWNERRTDVLQTDHNKSLGAAIELSLSSLLFRELGPNARDLLGVVAFFPQGIDENKIDWLFPTISGRKNIFDKFCVLSLAYRNDGFVTMLAPIRDHLSPKDPTLTPLLRLTRDHYFSRLSVFVEPGKPGFEEARWIVSEDVNVEHLLDVFTTIDGIGGNAWDTCVDFMRHLVWHKPRVVILGSKIEALADDHPSKLQCLFQLSRLFQSLGNRVERERLLTYTLKLSREQGDNHQIAETLRHLCNAHRKMELYKEGIEEAKEALEIFERLGNTMGQTLCLMELAWLFNYDNQLDAAEEAALHAISLLSETDHQYSVCQCHNLLGTIYRSKGKTEKAIHHFEAALEIASSHGWLHELFWTRFSMALLFSDQGKLDDANTHVKHAKSHAVDNRDIYPLARAINLQALLWHKQHWFGEAKSEVSRAIDAFEKLGAAGDAKSARMLLELIDRDARASGQS